MSIWEARDGKENGEGPGGCFFCVSKLLLVDCRGEYGETIG
jgi:hypothetical protein